MTTEIDEIKDCINEYRLQERIVFFVGAGVSALSGYPSWRDLIIDMANRINYSISLKDEKGMPALSSDEYLKIPQMFYATQKNEYFNYIKKKLQVFKEPNDIHRLIMQIKPNHILTTNYDTLIEQASNMAGLAYSVINADNKVSKAPTNNYILKVHGDFEANNFVLTEGDYLNYENNFKLIDNLVKTIMSTNLVIFIGYGLGDYNIKLILNWVKQVQPESFIKPIFIYTGNRELTESEIEYYEGQQIRVVDANNFVRDIEEPSYNDRYYNTLIELMNDERKEKWYRSPIWSIDHFYKIIEPLKDVKYLRIEDMAGLFKDANILYTNILRCGDFEYLFDSYVKYNSLSNKRKRQMNEIISRFFNSGVEQILDAKHVFNEEFNSKISRGYVIDNGTFDVSYQDICSRIETYSDDLESKYEKAYDLYWVGRLNEAMDLYKEILAECYTNKRWILYFFSLINLYYIRQTIIQLYKKSNGIMLGYGEELKRIWSENDIKNMELSHLITDIPVDIRQYNFLQKLTALDYYKDELFGVYKQNDEVDKNIAKEIFTLGQQQNQKAKIKLFDAVNFIYKNKIAFDRFIEHEQFVKHLFDIKFKDLQLQGKHYENESKRNDLSFQEILLLIRTLAYDELQVFYENRDVDKINVDENTEKSFENYIDKLILYYEDVLKNIINDKELLISYLVRKDEVKNALYISTYYVNRKESVCRCIQAIMEPVLEIGLEEKITLLSRFRERIENIDSNIKGLLEDDIISRIVRCNKGTDKNIEFERNSIMLEASTIKQWYAGYKSDLISKILRESREEVVRNIAPLVEKIVV